MLGVDPALTVLFIMSLWAATACLMNELFGYFTLRFMDHLDQFDLPWRLSLTKSSEFNSVGLII